MEDNKEKDDSSRLRANENLLKASSFILFTVNNEDGSICSNLDLDNLNMLECIGFIAHCKNRLFELENIAESDDDDEVCEEEENEDK